jgi:myosin heavy subunit
VANAEELLGLEPGSLTTLILKRPDDRMGRSAGALVENKPAEGKVVLDALSRLIYGRTFKFCLQHCSTQSFPTPEDWITDLASPGGRAGFTELHLIDSPGWEQLDPAVPGHLHHLLLHYVEEKLHADYICACFTDEIEKYALEEIELGVIDYPDCGPSIDILEKPATGIIFLLEEASQQIKANDKALVDKIMATHLKTKVRVLLL